MNRFLISAVLLVVLTTTTTAWGHGFRIVNDSGKLTLLSDDPTAGGEPIYKVQSLLGPASFKSTDHPGFSVQSGIPLGSSISFDVLGPLWFTTGGTPPVPSPEDVDLLIESNDIFVPGTVTVTGTSGFQTGFLVGEYDGSGLGAFEHQLYYSWQVPSGVPTGVFAVAMQLRGTDNTGQAFIPTDPFVAVFNNGVPVGSLPAIADELFQVAVPEPSTFVLGGMAALGLYVCQRRRRWASRCARVLSFLSCDLFD